RRLWPRVRAGDRQAARPGRLESHLLPCRRTDRYPPPRRGAGIRGPCRTVLQREHPGRSRARGGAVAATRMISIIGLKNAGKTTFLVALAAELARRKFRVMTITHGSHAADVDRRAKARLRHWHEGKAERVMTAAWAPRPLFERTAAESGPISLARPYLEGAHIVLVQGFKPPPLPKIEVYRPVGGPTPV